MRELTRIDASAARAAPGVLAVLTAADARADGLGRCCRPRAANAQTGEPFAFAPQPLLAADKVRYVGEPVAVIVAETRDQALDAAEMVAVDYVPLPAVTTTDAAGAAGAPQIADEVPGNLCFDWRTGDSDAVDAGVCRGRACRPAAARQSPHRHQPDGAARHRRSVGRGARPLHRSCLGAEHPQHPRLTRRARSACRQRAVRFVAPDVGGGFGAKNFIYPEHVLIPWAAKRVGRPVKWIASRSEVFLADHQARDHVAEAALALDAQGRFLALGIESTANVGAYLVSAGGVQTFQYVHLPGTVYRIPAIALRVARS